jgi:uncharacterized protein (TIGR02996 family)
VPAPVVGGLPLPFGADLQGQPPQEAKEASLDLSTAASVGARKASSTGFILGEEGPVARAKAPPTAAHAVAGARRLQPRGAVNPSFFDAIGEAPDEDGPRLVYADWFDDHGDPNFEPGRAGSCRGEVVP